MTHGPRFGVPTFDPDFGSPADFAPAGAGGGGGGGGGLGIGSILSGLGIGSQIFGAFQQFQNNSRAKKLQQQAIQEFMRNEGIVREFARGRDLEVGDERAVNALDRSGARRTRLTAAQLTERGLSGGAFNQAIVDLERSRTERSGELEARLASSLPTRKAQRLPALTRFNEQLAQLTNAQATQAATTPSPFAGVGRALTQTGLGLTALNAAQQSRQQQQSNSDRQFQLAQGELDAFQQALEAQRQGFGQSQGVPSPSSSPSATGGRDIFNLGAGGFQDFGAPAFNLNGFGGFGDLGNASFNLGGLPANFFSQPFNNPFADFGSLARSRR